MDRKLLAKLYCKFIDENTKDKESTEYVIATLCSPLVTSFDDGADEQKELATRAERFAREVNKHLLNNIQMYKAENDVADVTDEALDEVDADCFQPLNQVQEDCMRNIAGVEQMSIEAYYNLAVSGIFLLDSQLKSKTISNPKNYYVVVMTWDAKNVTTTSATGMNLHQYVSGLMA